MTKRRITPDTKCVAVAQKKAEDRVAPSTFLELVLCTLRRRLITMDALELGSRMLSNQNAVSIEKKLRETLQLSQ